MNNFLRLSSPTPLVACLAAALVLGSVGCSKKEATPAPVAAAPTAASAVARPASQAVKYDPNLKPADIVWSSPEKKARWEADLARAREAAAAASAASSVKK